MGRWIVLFYGLNMVCASFIMIAYRGNLPDFTHIQLISPHFVEWMGRALFVVGFLAQLTLLFGICAVLTGILALCHVPRRWVEGISAILSVILLCSLAGDAITYRLYHFHYAAIGWDVAKVGAMSSVLVLGWAEWLCLLLVMVAAIVAEGYVAWAAWRLTVSPSIWRLEWWFCIIFLSSVGMAYGAMGWAWYRSKGISPGADLVFKAVRVVPYFGDVYAALVPGDYATRYIPAREGGVEMPVHAKRRVLHYPLRALKTKTPTHPLNIVMIVVDTWRYDTLTSNTTPEIMRFAKRAVQFQAHYSGGNCTQPGVFSLFYGLPATYWDSFLKAEQAPVLLKRLQDLHYRMGIFTSAPPTFPAFTKTVFSGLKGIALQTPGDSSVARDQAITQAFQAFLRQQSRAQPFFSFLFYDAVHNYCEAGAPFLGPFKPAVASCDRINLRATSERAPYWNRYRNAVHFTDHEVGQVLDALARGGYLENTIVMITADHGEQLNDYHDGYWVHASAYTPYQLRVPLLVYWPSQTPRVVQTITTHTDIPVTLLQHALGVANRSSDYSVGISLWAREKGNVSLPFWVVGSYGDYAVATPAAILRVYPAGDYTVLNWNTRPKRDFLSLDVLRAANQQMQRFFIRHSDKKKFAADQSR
ncbi:MAG: hypothetical protein A3J38_09095 [Gammaproteobacteria bacterium RIFCSPHIGHO2_12_FULL_45_9]|nr:MAG: hypothetical protein A3J38_09095 [Gammaproteobacteria bacterium RIFCSPHIGHO2_12_FULL_45_9]